MEPFLPRSDERGTTTPPRGGVPHGGKHPPGACPCWTRDVSSPSTRPVASNSARAAALLVLLGVGAVGTAVGAARYPGGNWVDAHAPGHSLWTNFLCDIARDVAVNGLHNPGASWGRAAEWALIAALCLFWWMVTPLLHPGGAGRKVRLLGTLAALGLLLVPVTRGVPHGVALVCGAGPGLAAAALVVRGLRHRPVLALLGVASLLLAALELGLYLTFRVAPMPVAVPATQRLAVLVAVAWMAGCAFVVLRGQEVDTAGVSSTGSPRAT